MSIISESRKIFSFHKTFYRHYAFFKKKKLDKESHYVYLRATKADHEPILELMKKAYFSEEPTYSALKIENPTIPLENASRSLQEGLTFVAKCKYDGCIVGTSINSTWCPADLDFKERMACSTDDRKIRSLLLFYAHLGRAVDLFHCYGVQKVFEVEYLFVSPEHRFRGIASKLMELSKLFAKDCGHKIVKVDATSAFTARICERLKMKKIYEIPYCAYLGQDMKPVFITLPPHSQCGVYIDDNTEICQKLKLK